MTSYTPRPGSVAARAIGLLDQMPMRRLPSAALARALDVDPKQIYALLDSPVRRGLLHVSKVARVVHFGLEPPEPARADPLAWTAAQVFRTDDLPYRALMGEKERSRRQPKQAQPDVDKRAAIRAALTDEWQSVRQLMTETGSSKWLVYDEVSAAVDEGHAEAWIDGGPKRARLYRRAR